MTEKKYTYSIGRRKTAVATVRLFDEKGESQINGKAIKEVYNREVDQKKIWEPFKVAELDPKKYCFTAVIKGSGPQGQLGALRHALSRALVKAEPESKAILKTAGFLTRDPRMVERKKTGRRKARKSEQFSKR